MKHIRTTVICIAVCLATWASRPAYAQNVTTGSLTGVASIHFTAGAVG